MHIPLLLLNSSSPLHFTAFTLQSVCLCVASWLLILILFPNRTAWCWSFNTTTSVVLLYWYLPLRILPALRCGNVPCLGTAFAFPRPMGYARKRCQGRCRWILTPSCGRLVPGKGRFFFAFPARTVLLCQGPLRTSGVGVLWTLFLWSRGPLRRILGTLCLSVVIRYGLVADTGAYPIPCGSGSLQSSSTFARRKLFLCIGSWMSV